MKDLVRLNAEKDPTYAPYCLRCSTMTRMTKLAPFYWKCNCGAIGDERLVKLEMIHLRGELPNSFRSACPSCVYDHNGIMYPGIELAVAVLVPSAVKYCQMCGRQE